MLTVAAVLAATVALCTALSLLIWLTVTTSVALYTGDSLRGMLTHDANAVIFRLPVIGQHLPQFDARTNEQRNRDDAFLSLGATFHREN